MEKLNYTEAQVTELVQAYASGETVETLAEKFGKSVKSIVGKLSREGVYKAKAKAAVARKTKADYIRELEAALGAAEGQLQTLEKASLEALKFLVDGNKFEQE